MPTSWSDVTVGQFQELKEVPSLGFDPIDSQLRILQILTGVSDETFLALPWSSVKGLLQKIDFINKTPDLKKLYRVNIKGRRYSVNYRPEMLNAGEYIDLMNLTADGKGDANIVKILSICLKPINIFGGRLAGCYKKTKEGVWIQTIESREWTEKNIPDNLKMDVVIPMSRFFLKTWQLSMDSIRLYLKEVGETELAKVETDLRKHMAGTRRWTL